MDLRSLVRWACKVCGDAFVPGRALGQANLFHVRRFAGGFRVTAGGQELGHAETEDQAIGMVLDWAEGRFVPKMA